MKTIQLGEEILRVKDDVAEEKVSKYGWVYIPRSIWKQKVRDPQRVARETGKKVAEDVKKVLNVLEEATKISKRKNGKGKVNKSI